jgi:hypothetical protein
MSEDTKLGRRPNLELLSLSERERIRAEAQGDPAEYKRLLMVATRAAQKRQRLAGVLELGKHVTRTPEGQLRFLGEEFDEELRDEDLRQALRRRAQTDLWFLCVDVLGKDLTERTHREIVDFYVKKNPDLPFKQQDPIHERDLFDPRGAFKSTIQIIDAIQWLICFPEIRILFLAGAKDLPAKMLRQFRDYFVIKDGKPTKFQQLFPEFCILPSEAYETSYDAPCRKNPNNDGEPTAEARSNESVNSGFHYELIICDDLVDNENSQNETQLEKTARNFYINVEMLVAGGYINITGTRYDVGDLYGKRIASPHEGYKSLTRAALWARKDLPAERRAQLERDLRNRQLPTAHFSEADWEILFPEQLSFRELMVKRSQDMRAFAGQRLNDPVTAGDDVQYTRELLRSVTVNPAQIPFGGKVFTLWDLAYSTKKGAKYTVGGTIRVDCRGRVILLEAIRGKFLTHELVGHIVDTIARWQPEITHIENSMGAKWLLGDLQREAMRRGVKLNLDWFPIDNSQDAKDGRIYGMEAYMVAKRLLLSAGVRDLEVLYEELERYGKLEHNDFADMLALQVAKHMPPIGDASEDAEVRAAIQELKDKDLKDHLYGLGIYEESEEPPAPEPDAYELDNLLGALRE